MSVREARARLLKRLTDRTAEARPATIPRRDPAAPLRLSYGQERLWFLEQFSPGTPVYNVPAARRWRGPLRIPALRAALNGVVQRHESLRTTFAVALPDRLPLQVIAPRLEVELPCVDLSGAPASQREELLAGILTAELRKPFDLARGPLVRTLLVRMGEDDHAFAVTLHHAVADGWSMAILFRELTELYRALLYREAPRLSELPVQYADFALWQRAFLQGEELERQLSYWRRALDGAPEVLDLPLDRPRPETQAFDGARHPLALPGALAGALKALGRERGATLFMTLLAVFQTLLHRYTGATDLVTGSPVANRRRAELEGLIGYFANTLALRADLTGSPSFEELLGRVRAAALGALDHQDVPFEKLVEELRPQRSLSHNPLFQVLFALQNLPGALFDLPEVATGRQPFEPRTAKFDLMLELHDRPEGLIGAFEYSTDLFAAATIARLAGHFRALLEAVVRHPDRRLSELPLLTAAERRQVLAEWNDTAAAYPEELCLHDLFTAQASRTPQATAVVGAEGERWTYGELAERARRLAARLRREGVGPDVPVALCVERSPALLAGVLAILEAGGGYLPLDPGYPAGRLAFMLEDSGTRILLAQPELAGRLPVAGRKVVALEESAWERPQPGDGRSAPRPLPDNLAYLTFTSGSTGRPKGVAMPHRPLVNLIAWQIRTFAPPVAAPTLQLAPLTFDVSFQEIFSTLGAGGTLVLVPERLRRDPEELRALLARERVERLFAPFVALQQLAETGEKEGERVALREIFTAGERLQITPALASWIEGMPGCALHNHYGPSETHAATAFQLAGPAASWPVLPPIGRPLANVRVHLLDGQGAPAPPGIAGELCIGGLGLARGYAGRPDLTADRFVPDPLGIAPGARLYRTGDLARYRPDGQIEFLGRNDQQVKIRGFRVEPEEIEAALARHPGVSQAAVVAQEDKGVSRRLVAFLVAASEPRPEAAVLREHLGRQLPDYMIPSAFVWLEALPATSSGKVDRLALARTPAAAPEPRRSATDFRTPVEGMLAEIWADVLGGPGVTPEDDFFELGGHSLLATQAVSRIRDVFGIGLPLRALFEEPTLGRLARVVERALRAEPDGIPPLRQRSWESDPPLSFAQQRLWFLDQLVGASPLYNMPARFRLSGRLDVGALQRSIDEIVRRHDSIRTTFVSREGRAAQRIAPALSVPLCRVDLGGLPAPTAQACALEIASVEARAPFDLEKGPLMRAALLQIGPQDHLLLLTLHHIISDGWSIGILFRELGALYEAFSAGAPSPLPELAVQYPDFAVWQRGWLCGEVLEAELAYWRERLAGVPALELSTDRPRPSVETVRGAVRTRLLGAALLAGLRDLTRREQVTLFMALLAGFQTLLHRCTGQDDVAVGSGIANRRRTEIEPLIGFFVNTLVLRTDLGGEPSFLELLRRVRETCLGAYAHEDLPFEKLVDELMPERSLSRNPLCEVMLVLQNFPQTLLRLRGLTLEPLRIHSGTAKLDLILFVDVRDDGLLVSAEYRSALFDGTTMDRLLGHVERLLAAAVLSPGTRLDDLPLMSEPELHQVRVEWNDSRRRYPRQACLHELFEAWAEILPDALALEFEGKALSYGELNRRANRLAHRLLAVRRELGEGPGWPVGIYLERSADLVMVMLAVLKSGGAYVPLDPSHPPERLAFLLEDVGARVVLTRGGTLPDDLAAPHVRALGLEESGGPESMDESNPISGAVATGPALVLYTSGSTGRPKGVLLPHQGIVRLVRDTDFLRLGPDDRVAQALNVSFDCASFEIWSALVNGAGLVVIPREVVLAPRDLAARVAASGVRLLLLTTTLFNQVVREVPGAFRSLRYFLLAGEAADPGSLRSVLESGAPGRLINAYGPTEATVLASFQPIDAVADGAVSVPIGRPLSNAHVRVLDRTGRPVPIGVLGEVYLGGEAPAIGYAGRPDLTAERFVPDPFGDAPGGRLYRTGDLARYLPAGAVDFLGRADQQVKVRGFRVEPGEIEAVLRQHPEVGDAVVLPRQDDAGHLRLVACVSRRLAATRELDREWQDERVAQWQAIYDEIYQRAIPEDPTFNLAGWHSSYTGEPLPAEAMREWVEATVERIQRQGARRILEIGCGTGLLLFRLAAQCETYVATDFSAPVLRALQAHLERLPGDRIRLLQRSADDFTGIEPGSFDAVMLNSVAQYFPSADYLVRVLRGAVRAVAPGGSVFVGDLRSLAHLEAFHASVQLAQAPEPLPLAQLRQRVRQRQAQEQELLVDPAFFSALPSSLPEIGGVDVWLRRGRTWNELTCFRYDAILRVGPQSRAGVESWHDWQKGGWTLARLHAMLRGSGCDPLGLRNLPNARVQEPVRLARRLSAAGPGTAGDLRQAPGGEEGVDPEHLWELAGELGWEVGVTWSADDPALCDAVFWRRGAAPAAWSPPRRIQPRAWLHYTNNPLQAKLASRIVPGLRDHLRSRLPEYMVPASFVVLDVMPLMAQGKVDRQALMALEHDQPLAEKGFVAPRDEAEAALAEIWARVLGLEQVGVQDNFFELGGDSILSLQVVAQAREAGLRFTPRQLFEHQTVAALAQAARKDRVRDESRDDDAAGEVPLTPIQRWLFARSRLGMPDPHHFNQALLLEVRSPLDPTVLAGALAAVARHHDALRLRFEPVDAGWRQHYAGDGEWPLARIDLAALPDGLLSHAVEGAAAALQARLDVVHGPLLLAALFQAGQGRPDRLLLVVHHLVVDGVSWRVLLEDLVTACRQLEAGADAALPPKTSSFQAWARRLAEHARSPEVRSEAEFWLASPERQAATLPMEGEGDNTLASERRIAVALSAEETQSLLQDVPAVYNTRINDALLTALLETFAEWTGDGTLELHLEGHGREDLFPDLDLSRTVGWFTCIFPVRLQRPGGDDPGEVLKSVKEQLRSIPAGGIGHGLLRHLAGDEALASRLDAADRARVAFNYLGQLDSMLSASSPFARGRESSGPYQSPRGERAHLFEINSVVIGGRLEVTWTYSRNLHREDTVRRLAEAFLDHLRTLLRHCRSAEAGGYTPSDFPLARLGQEKLDSLLSRLGRTREI